MPIREKSNSGNMEASLVKSTSARKFSMALLLICNPSSRAAGKSKLLKIYVGKVPVLKR